jgi:hypothetical protein
MAGKKKKKADGNGFKGAHVHDQAHIQGSHSVTGQKVSDVGPQISRIQATRVLHNRYQQAGCYMTGMLRKSKCNHNSARTS